MSRPDMPLEDLPRAGHPQFALGQALGYTAFTWGYPLVETQRTCRLQVQVPEHLQLQPGAGNSAASTPPPSAAWHAPIDRLRHRLEVATEADRDVVTPANDLLYTNGWIHLADGPRLLRVPASARHPGRYFVLALYDAWTNNFANPGLRESPPQGETLVLVGPGTSDEAVARAVVAAGMDGDNSANALAARTASVRVVHSPTPLVWLIARVLAGEGDDVHAARALQAEITLDALPGSDHGRLPHAVQHGCGPPQETLAALQERPAQADQIAAAFFNNLCHALVDQPVPPADAGLAHWLARGGLAPSPNFEFMQLDAPLRAGLQRGLQDAAAAIEHASRSRRARPWAMNMQIGRYGTDYLLRALTAYKGLAALAAEEALYAMCDFDAERAPLHGRHAYVQRFEPGELPPVDGFWSVTLYDADRFLYRNSACRYALGDRTRGLTFDADGGLTLHIAHLPPTDSAAKANWLPAPAGSFYLVLRLYVPRADVRSWRIPPLHKAALTQSSSPPAGSPAATAP